jgi:peptidoglycan/LPS O-acetylase OafA/YrhL
MPDSNEKPPVRPIFRKLAWVVAAISFFCALVAITGFMGEDRLSGTLVFLFCGFIFTTIALTGFWSTRSAKEVVTREAGSTNLIVAIICMLCFIQGVDEVVKANFVNRLLGWVQIVAGGVGMIAGMMVFLKQRKEAKQSSQQQPEVSNGRQH